VRLDPGDSFAVGKLQREGHCRQGHIR
jgi:hypothetical protein